MDECIAIEMYGHVTVIRIATAIVEDVGRDQGKEPRSVFEDRRRSSLCPVLSSSVFYTGQCMTHGIVSQDPLVRDLGFKYASGISPRP